MASNIRMRDPVATAPGIRTREPAAALGPSLTQQAAILGKSAFAGAAGSIPDLAMMPYNIPAMASNVQQEFIEQVRERHPTLAKIREYTPDPVTLIKKAFGQKELPMVPSATEGIEHGIDTITGGYTKTPEEMKDFAEGAQLAGSLAGPGGLAKGAQKLGAKSAEKILGALGTTKPSELIGAGAAGTTISSQKENLGELGALGAGLLTGAGAQKTAQAIGKAPSAIGKFVKAPGEETIGRILSLGANPKENIVKEMREAGFNVPFHVQLNSPLAYEIANGLRHNFLLAKEYKDQMTNLPQDMLNRAIEIIDKVHPEVLGREESSAAYRELHKKLYPETKAQVQKMYDLNSQSIKEGDVVNPDLIYRETDKIKKEILKSGRRSDDQKDVLAAIEEMEREFGRKKLSNQEPIFFGKEKISPQDPRYEKISKNLISKSDDIPLERLDATRSSFLQDTKYDKQYGIRGYFDRIVDILNKAIEQQPNKEYAKGIKATREFSKNQFYQTLQSDLANSIREGHAPLLAYDYMKSPEKVHELERIAGNTPAAKQIMNALKRSKAQQVIVKAIENPSDRGLSFSNLSKIGSKDFQKSGFYKALLGKENFDELKKLSDFAAEYSYAGKQSHHPGTATKAAELEKAKTIGKNTFDILRGDMNLVDYGTSLVGYTGVPYVISKMVSNPKFIKAAVRFAEARKLNKIKDIKAAQTNMRQIFLRQIAPQLRQTITQQEEE